MLDIILHFVSGVSKIQLRKKLDLSLAEVENNIRDLLKKQQISGYEI